MDYAKQEVLKKERIVCESEHWVVLVPFWAFWPFETMILPIKRHIKSLLDINSVSSFRQLNVLKKLLRKNWFFRRRRRTWHR